MVEAVFTEAVAEVAFIAAVEAITAGATVAEAMAAKAVEPMAARAVENRAAGLMMACVVECDPVPAAAPVAAQARVDAI